MQEPSEAVIDVEATSVSVMAHLNEFVEQRLEFEQRMAIWTNIT